MSNVVEAWGIGRPDSTVGTPFASTPWILNFDFDLSATTELTVDLYTIPTGKRLVIMFIKGSCSASFIQPVKLIVGGTTVCGLWFDKTLIEPVPDPGGYCFTAGETMQGYFNNVDSVEHNYKGAIVGHLEDV